MKVTKIQEGDMNMADDKDEFSKAFEGLLEHSKNTPSDSSEDELLSLGKTLKNAFGFIDTLPTLNLEEQEVDMSGVHSCQALEKLEDEFTGLHIEKADDGVHFNIFHDEGGGSCMIHFCPFCGEKLDETI